MFQIAQTNLPSKAFESVSSRPASDLKDYSQQRKSNEAAAMDDRFRLCTPIYTFSWLIAVCPPVPFRSPDRSIRHPSLIYAVEYRPSSNLHVTCNRAWPPVAAAMEVNTCFRFACGKWRAFIEAAIVRKRPLSAHNILILLDRHPYVCKMRLSTSLCSVGFGRRRLVTPPTARRTLGW